MPGRALLWQRWRASALLAALALALPAFAQTAAHEPESLPAAQARQEIDPDSMAARTLACTACHGREGRATPQGYYPRIAGKPDGYLYHQLRNFREGRRSYPQMTHLLQFMSDDYLHEIAQYFAALDLPHATPAPAPASAAQRARGQLLVQQGDAARDIPACVQCHGDQLTGVQPFIPGLLGLSRDYLNAQLGAWQTGQRQALAPDCMERIAQRLSGADVAAITAWLTAQPVPDHGRPAARLAAPMPLRCGAVPEALAGGQP